jgi:hypothetical protein
MCPPPLPQVKSVAVRTRSPVVRAQFFRRTPEAEHFFPTLFEVCVCCPTNSLHQFTTQGHCDLGYRGPKARGG